MRIGSCAKLAPFYFGLFEILERITPISYQLVLPPSLSHIHDVFHVSILRQYIPNVIHALDWDTLQVEDVQLSLEPIRMLQHQRMTLRG